MAESIKQQLNENFAYVSNFIQENIPEIRVISGDATYLMWINVPKVANNSAELVEFLRKETGLIVSAGNVYRGNGQDFIRINLACPLAMVKDGMNRLAEGFVSIANRFTCKLKSRYIIKKRVSFLLSQSIYFM